jgi:hypothetical protein
MIFEAAVEAITQEWRKIPPGVKFRLNEGVSAVCIAALSSGHARPLLFFWILVLAQLF